MIDFIIIKLFEFFDTDSSGKLDCYEFICGLGLLSQSTLKQKAEIIFNLYDFDKSKLISQDEMVVLVKTVMSALNVMCKKPEATIQQAETKTLDILKKYDTNKDGEISLKEFQSFVSKDPEILRYLTTYNLIAHDDLRPDFGGGEGEAIPDVDSDLEAEIKIKDNGNINPMAERIKSGIEHTHKSKFEEDDCPYGHHHNKEVPANLSQQQAWVTQVKNSIPSDYKPRPGESNPPEASLQLDYVYGYRCHDCRNNLKYGPTGEIVYHTAAVGLVLDPKKNLQQFFLEHTDDVISIDVYETLCLTGQVGVSPMLCIWDLKTMQSRLILKGVLQKGINHVCFSNDGRKFAAAGLDEDHCVIVYDLEKAIAAKQNPLLAKGKSAENLGLLASGKTTKSEIFDMKFEPTDKGLIAAGLKEVLFLNFEGGVLKMLKGSWENYPLQAVLCISFIETNVVTGMFKGELFVWKGNRPYNSVKAHNGPVNAICSRKSAKGLITGGNDGVVIIWEANLKILSKINLVDPGLRILNPKIRALNELNGNILVGTRSGEIIEFLGGTKANFLMRGHYSGELWGLTTHPNTSQAFTVGDEHLLVNWDLSSRKAKVFSKLDYPARTLHISPDCKYLSVGCLNGSVLIIDPKSLTIITTLKDRQSEVTVVKFSPVAGGYLAVAFGSPDHELFIYNIKANFKIQSKLKGSNSKIMHLDFSEDATKLQFTNTSNEIFFYDVKSGKREPNAASLLKDEKWASWTLPVGWPVQGIWPPYTQGCDINSVDRSYNFETIVSGDDFGKVKLFKYPSSKEKAAFSQFLGHAAQVTTVRFSFKNEYVVSLGGADKSVFQWKYITDKQAQEEGNMAFGEEEDDETTYGHGLFEEEKLDEGDQFMAVKPFKGEVEHSVPSWFKPGKRDNDLPNGNLALRYVHGYRCFDMYNGAKYGKRGEVIFIQAALGVIMENKGGNKAFEQSFFQMHEEDIISLALHPKLNIVATGQMAKVGKAKTIDVYVWDGETKAILSHMNDFHLRAVNQLGFSPDGSKLLSVGQDDDNSLAIHDWQGKILLTTSKVDKSKVSAVAWKNDQVFVTVGPKHIKFWTLNGRNLTGKRGVFGQQNKQEPLVSVTFAYTNNQYCVTGSKSGNLYLWTGEAANKPLKAHNGEVSVLLSNKQTLYSGGEDGIVIIWSFGGGGALTKTAQVCEMATLSKYRPGIRSLDIKTDGTLLVGTRGAELYEGKQGVNWTAILQGHFEGELWGCAVSPGTYRFATCGGDKTVRLWDAQTKKMLVGTEPFEQDCRAVDWARTGKFLVMGDTKGKIFILDANTLQVLSSLQSSFKSVEQGKGRPALDPWIEDIKISPNCQMVAFGAHAGASNVEIMAINNNKLQTKGMIKAGLTSALTHLDWSNDSDFLVINSQAYELKFANVSSLKPVSASSSKDVDWATWTCTLGFYSQGIFGAGMDGTDVNSVSRANNKKVLATGDDFGKVNLFKYPSVIEKSLNKQYSGHSSHVTKVKFSFDDCFLMSVGGNDKAVIIWETDFGSGDQNKADIIVEKEDANEQEEEIDRSHFLQKKKKMVGADKFKQYKDGFIANQEVEKQKKVDKKPEDDIYGEEEDKGDESMTIKPWMGAIKEPQGYIKPPLNQDKPPLISLELTFIHGYRSKDSRNNLKYLKNGNSIVYPAAGVGVVFDMASNKQRFFTLHNDDITALALSSDGVTVATGEIGQKASIYVWDSNTMLKVCEFKGPLTKGIAALAFNPNGDKLAAAAIDDANTVAVFEVKVQNGAVLSVSKSGTESIFDLSFKNDCEFVEVGVSHIRFWNFANKTLNCKSGAIPNTVSKVLVTAKHNADDCVVGDNIGNLQVWKEGMMIGFYKLHEGGIDALSVQASYILTGGRDSLIKILDKSYSPLVVYIAEQNIKFSLYPAIRSLCFSSDFKSILLGTLGGEIYEIQTK